MLKIRLQRVGRKNDPSFRIINTDSKSGPKSGKSVEILGSYDARRNAVNVKGDRVLYWISQGAQVSDTVHNILIKQGIIKGKKKNVASIKKKEGGDEKVGEEKKDGSPNEAKVASDSPEATASQGSPNTKDEVKEDTGETATDEPQASEAQAQTSKPETPEQPQEANEEKETTEEKSQPEEQKLKEGGKEKKE